MSKAADEAKLKARDCWMKRGRPPTNWFQAGRNTAPGGPHPHKTLIGRAQKEVFAIARHALTDLAGASLEERMGAVFLDRLGALDAKAKVELAEVLETAANPRSFAAPLNFRRHSAQRS